MSTSTVRSALVGAGIALASVTPTAVADGLRTRTVKLVELCVPMAPEDVDNRTSVSMRLQSILPDDHGCEVVIRVNNGMGPKDILSPTVPFGEGAYINVYGPTGAREERAIIGTCTPD